MRVRQHGPSAHDLPPADLVWPRFCDLLDPDEYAVAVEQLRGGDQAAGYVGVRRLHERRRRWVRERWPELGELGVTGKCREVFAREVPGRPDVPPRPPLPIWDGSR